VGLQEKLKGAADLDAAVAIAKEAGFDVSKADWLRYQARHTLELSEEELERVAGGGGECASMVKNCSSYETCKMFGLTGCDYW